MRSYNCTKLEYIHQLELQLRYYNERNEQNKNMKRIWFVEALLILLYSLQALCCAGASFFCFSTRLSRVQCSGLNYFHFFDNKTFFFVVVVVAWSERERKISRKKAFYSKFFMVYTQEINFRACPSDVRQCGIQSILSHGHECIYIYSFFLNQLCISLRKGQRATHTSPGTRLDSTRFI